MMKIGTAILGLLTALVVAGMLAGCMPPGTASTGGPSARVELTYPGEDWGYPAPFTFYARGPGYLRMSFLFDTLTWKDEGGVIPWLADEWEVGDDGTTWTFRLHPDVTFHDGQPLTAQDVAFTFEYFRDHAQAFRWSAPIDKVAAAEAPSSQVAVIRLTEPVAGALEDLFGSLPILPKHIWEEVEAPDQFTEPAAVLGSGPFKLVEYSKEEGRYVYEANPGYFKGRPIADRVTFIKVQSSALALKTGIVDAASFWGKEIAAVHEFEDDPDVGIVEGPSYWVLQLIYNTQKAPFDDPEARRAIAHAVDRERLVEQVVHDGAIVASPGIISPGTSWHEPDLPHYAHDTGVARAMLEELGLAGRRLTLITTPDYGREAELIQADLVAAGLEVDLRSGDTATVDALLKDGAFDLAVSGHGSIANPSTLRDPPWPATGLYQNEEYARLFQEQSRTMDEETRRTLVSELQRIVAQDLPVLTLYHPKMWCVYNQDKLDSYFFTAGGIALGIPLEMNKLVFLPEAASDR